LHWHVGLEVTACRSRCTKCELLKGEEGACPFGCDQNCNCYDPLSSWKCRHAGCDHCNCPEAEGGCKCDDACACRTPTVAPTIGPIVLETKYASENDDDGKGCPTNNCKIPIIVAAMSFAGTVVAAVIGVAWSRRKGQMAADYPAGLPSGAMTPISNSSYAPSHSGQSNPAGTSSNPSLTSTAGSSTALLGGHPYGGSNANNVNSAPYAAESRAPLASPCPVTALDFRQTQKELSLY
jgi:hypothetical protein